MSSIYLFKLPIKASSAFIQNDKNEVLLLKRSKSVKSYRGFWQLPEGKIKSKESAKQALKREIEEELGCDLTIIKKIGSFSYIHKFLFLPIVKIERIVFSVETPTKIMISEEHTDYAWVGLNQLDNYQLLPGLKNIIKKLST